MLAGHGQLPKSLHSCRVVRTFTPACIEARQRIAAPVQPRQAAAAVEAGATQKKVPQPSVVRRCRDSHAVCWLLYKHHSSVSPQFWVTALCHLSQLVSAGGQQVSLDSWRQLKHCLTYLTQPQGSSHTEQQLENGEHQPILQQQQQQNAANEKQEQQQQVGLSQKQQQWPPITQFAAADVATLLWALAKLRARIPRAAWPHILQHIAACSPSLSPRDTSLLAWSLLQLAAPMPAGWFQQLLDVQAGALPHYPTRSLVMLLHASARLGARLPASSTAAVLSALSTRFRQMNSHDLSVLLWSLAPLDIKPPAAWMAAALAASKRQLSIASCRELTALVVGVARLSYLPPGPWLLELYDQLYWTADQLEGRQLAGMVWALGRLRAVAVPQELMERLLAFAQLALRPALEQQQQQQREEVFKGQQAARTLHVAAAGSREAVDASGIGSGGSSSDESSTDADASNSSSSSSVQQYNTAKQLYWLMLGLAGLRRQLSPATHASKLCAAWLLAVLAGQGPLSHIHVPACMHAAALLRVRLPPHSCQAVLMRLSGLRARLGHTGLALGLWGAVGVGCRPDRAWLEAWWGDSQALMGVASAAEVNMLLHACVVLQQHPPGGWLAAAYQRLGQQVHSSSGSSMVATLKALLALQQSVPAGLLRQMGARVEQLEVQRKESHAVRHFQQYAAQLKGLAAASGSAGSAGS